MNGDNRELWRECRESEECGGLQRRKRSLRSLRKYVAPYIDVGGEEGNASRSEKGEEESVDLGEKSRPRQPAR